MDHWSKNAPPAALAQPELAAITSSRKGELDPFPTHKVWAPLVHLTHLRHLRYRRRLAREGSPPGHLVSPSMESRPEVLAHHRLERMQRLTDSQGEPRERQLSDRD